MKNNMIFITFTLLAISNTIAIADIKKMNNINEANPNTDVFISCNSYENSINLDSHISSYNNKKTESVVIRKKRKCIKNSTLKLIYAELYNNYIENNKNKGYKKNEISYIARDVARSTVPVVAKNSILISLSLKGNKHNALLKNFIHKVAYDGGLDANKWIQKKLGIKETGNDDVRTILAIKKMK